MFTHDSISDSLIMIIHPPKEPAPLLAGLAIIEQKVRAIFVGRIPSLPWPMIMRYDMTQ
jgi:hypothetical protein